MAQQIPEKLGSYQVVERIGAGGMATIFKGYHPAMDRYVAIKVLSQELANDPALVARFQREVKTIARLEHRHILPVYDVGETAGISFMVMRYVDGGTLADLINNGQLTLDRGVRLVIQVAEALGYAHRHGIIHRDIKPSNVLIGRDGDALLSDFGIAKIMLEQTMQLTSEGSVIGTPFYMAPEVIQAQPADARSDIYALGVVLYEVLTGRRPFVAETPLTVALMHVQQPPPPINQFNPNVPPALEQVVQRALAKQPSDRYQTADELAQALQSALSHTPGVYLAPSGYGTSPATPYQQGQATPYQQGPSTPYQQGQATPQPNDTRVYSPGTPPGGGSYGTPPQGYPQTPHPAGPHHGTPPQGYQPQGYPQTAQATGRRTSLLIALSLGGVVVLALLWLFVLRPKDSGTIGLANPTATAGSQTPTTQPAADSDNDGVLDADDACPNDPGLPESSGCPAPTTQPTDEDPDGDGLLGADDACPNDPGTLDDKGCPPLPTEIPVEDSDGDGVIDADDACPKDPGIPEEKGCPAAPTEEHKLPVNSVTIPSPIQTLPAVLDDLVFVGAKDGQIYQINRQTGDSFPFFKTEGEIYSSPAIADGVIYFGSFDGNLYAVGIENQNEIWKFPTGKQIWTGPALSGDLVFVGGDSGVLHAVERSSGKERWSKDLGAIISTGPKQVGPHLYVATVDGRLFAFDPASGDEAWVYPVEAQSRIQSMVGAEDGVVYFGANDGHLYALFEDSGKEKWRHKVGGEIWTTPLVHDGMVFFGSHDGHIRGLDVESQLPLFEIPTGDKIASALVLHEHVLYFGNDADLIMGVDIITSDIVEQYKAGGNVNNIVLDDGILYIGGGDGVLQMYRA